MKTAEDILALFAADSSRLHLLRVLREVGPEGAWIGAGFVRNAVWDHLHGYGEATPLADIDVLHFAPRALDPQADADFEAALRRRCEAPWSVKNQARMHLRNGDRPYRGLRRCAVPLGGNVHGGGAAARRRTPGATGTAGR